VRLFPRLPILFCLATIASGCSSWEARAEPASAIVGDSAPERVRVTRTNSSQVVLVSPALARDTLRGLVEGSEDRMVAIPVSGIQQLAVRDLDPLKTAGLIAGVLLLSALILFTLAFAQGLASWYDEISEVEE
jgi:hypothetical protein